MGWKMYGKLLTAKGAFEMCPWSIRPFQYRQLLVQYELMFLDHARYKMIKDSELKWFLFFFQDRVESVVGIPCVHLNSNSINCCYREDLLHAGVLTESSMTLRFFILFFASAPERFVYLVKPKSDFLFCCPFCPSCRVAV